MKPTANFFSSILTALILFLFARPDSCRARSLNNILGCSDDTLVNGIDFSARMAGLPNHFTRIQASWPEINPARSVFNFTNAPSCNDAIIATAAAQGRVILFDVNEWPAWVQADWSNRYADMSVYVTSVLKRWPQVQILGCWNEPSPFPPPNGDIIPGITNAGPQQLMPEYHVLVTTIYKAKMGVNPSVKLDIGKFVNFQSYPAYFQAMKSLGTWTMGDYITWHDGNDGSMNPLIDNPATSSGAATPSVAHQLQWAQALFPGKLVGCDEHYSFDFTRCIQSAAAYRANGAAMLVEQLLPYPASPPMPAPSHPFTESIAKAVSALAPNTSYKFSPCLPMPSKNFGTTCKTNNPSDHADDHHCLRSAENRC
jgi:hypothetical protein